MQQPTSSNALPTTVADLLDRLEVIAENIGTISRENGFILLRGLDTAYLEIQQLEPGSQSRNIVETQFGTITARLRSDAGQFMRDIGGAHILEEERRKTNPPDAHDWWFIDAYLSAARKARVKRLLLAGAAALAVIAVITIIYRQFLAPDPQFVAVYGHEQASVDRMMAGDLDAALLEVEQGLAINPDVATLLTMQGVIFEAQGKAGESEAAFAKSRQIIGNDAAFYVMRGQVYTYIGQAEKALADGRQAAQINPQMAEAFMLTGMAYELVDKRPEALAEYQKAFDAANATGSLELAALARTRIAFLMQGAGGGMLAPSAQQTQQP